MLNFTIFNSSNPITSKIRTEIVEFLHKHLEQFCDPKDSINKAISYAMNETSGPGGFILQGKLGDDTVGVVVMNKTGMDDYIPANILVYIAVDRRFRGKGFGRELMGKAIAIADGSVKLHVEHDNPARFLYEKIGFTNKYMEMRLIR